MKKLEGRIGKVKQMSQKMRRNWQIFKSKRDFFKSKNKGARCSDSCLKSQLLRRQRQEDSHKCKASLVYIARVRLK